MTALAASTGTQAVSLHELLTSRDQRAERQEAWLARHRAPVVSLTVVMPGPVKDNAWSRRAFADATARFDRLCAERGWPVPSRAQRFPASGPEALYAVQAGAAVLKAATIAIEDGSPVGRLWDFDVRPPGLPALSRRSLGLPPRRCLVCGQPAHACGRAQRHPLDQLLAAIAGIMDGRQADDW